MTIMYQAPTGDLRAVLAGQPVGRVIPAIAGMPEALQATALSKGTLARHPKSGVRNLANGAQAVSNQTYWPNTASGGGITATKIGVGVESDGVPYIDVRYTGTAISQSISTTYNPVNSWTENVIGASKTSSLSAKIIAGSLPSIPSGNRGVIAVVNELTSGGVYVAGSGSSTRANTEEYTDVSVTRVSSAPSATVASGVPQLTFVVGDVIDVTYRIKGFQFESGPIKTPLQFNYGPNDITEAGVPDLWHLYNDGGDSLMAGLPAGNYTVAWVSALGTVTITDGVAVAAGGTNILLGERIADVLFLRRTPSDAEKRALTAYWESEFKV